MFKFLRKYNKWLLAVATCFLMIAFLLPSTGLLKDGAQQGNVMTARLGDGRELTLNDRRTAAAELAILTQATRDTFLLKGESDDTSDKDGSPDRWMLIQAEAKRLGVEASENDVRNALFVLGFGGTDAQGKSTGSLDEARLNEFCAKINTTEAGLRQALKSYLRAETVRQLVSGVAHDDLNHQAAGLVPPGLQRLFLQQQAANMQRQAFMAMSGDNGNPQEAQMQAMRLMGMSNAIRAIEQGAQRQSTPLLAHQLQNLHAGIAGQLVLVPAATPTRLNAQGEPTQAQLNELFNAFKDSPRPSPPYGFGYRLPSRFKIEALVIPAAQARLAAEKNITEAKVREYFEAHREAFATKPGETAELSVENREKAREQLLKETTAEQALAFAKTAEHVLDADWRKAASHDNQLPQGATPTPLQAAADAITAKHGFKPALLSETQIEGAALAALTQKTPETPPLPTVGRETGWMTQAECANHPLLGHAVLAVQPGVLLTQAANHLAGDSAHLPSGLDLAVNLRLPTAITQAGDCIVARVTGAQAPRPAASVEEVKALLTLDARELAAFRTLAAHADALLANVVVKNGLKDFASKNDRLFPVPRLTRVAADSPATTPKVQGLDNSAALVKAVFERAEALRTAPGGVKGAALKDRLVAVPVEGQRAVALFEIQDYSPIPQSENQELVQSPISRFASHTTLLASHDAKQEDPLSEKNLKDRLGWVSK